MENCFVTKSVPVVIAGSLNLDIIMTELNTIIEDIIAATRVGDLIWKMTHNKKVDGKKVDGKSVFTVQYETTRNDVVIVILEASRGAERTYNIGIDNYVLGESVSQDALGRLFNEIKSNYLRDLVKRLNFDYKH